MRTLLAASLAALALLAAAGAPARTDGGVQGRFDQHAGFSHSLPDDPIVFPGQPGASHMHDFFCFTRTNAFTTSAEMQAALEEDPIPTTCTERGKGGPRARNVSGYWKPALYVNGVKVDPARAHIYYRNQGNGDVELFPAGGFVMIAGDPNAPPEEQRGRLSWWCGSRSNSTFDHIPEDCDQHDVLHASVSFPTCWNGELDSQDHRSHIVYAEDHGGRCPASHRKRLARIVIHTAYPVSDGLGRRLDPANDVVTLSSGPMTSMHADYMFGWAQDRIDQLVVECLNAGRDCKRHPPPDDAHGRR